MKRWFVSVFALWFTSSVFPGFRLSPGLTGLFISGCILSLLLVIIKPILSILFIPINFLTFGLASWIINVIVIYILTILSPVLHITPWTFPGIQWGSLTLSSIYLSYASSLVVSTVIMTIFSNILDALFE